MTSEDRVLKTQKADHRSLWFIEPRKVKATEQWKGVVSVFMLIQRSCVNVRTLIGDPRPPTARACDLKVQKYS